MITCDTVKQSIIHSLCTIETLLVTDCQKINATTSNATNQELCLRKHCRCLNDSWQEEKNKKQKKHNAILSKVYDISLI